MEPEAEIKNREEQAKRLQKNFNEKVLDLFIEECEQLMSEGIKLKEFSEYYKLEYDMEEQYHSMKKVLTEAERLVDIANTE